MLGYLKNVICCNVIVIYGVYMFYNMEELLVKKRSLALTLTLAIVIMAFAGCSAKPAAHSENAANGEYQFVSVSDTLKAAKDGKTHVLDVREWSNYVNGRVANSEFCPIFPLDNETLSDSMKAYAHNNLKDGGKIYIICNSGNKGAQKATAVLKEAGISADLLFTVEGGAKALANEKGALTTNRTEENISWKYAKANLFHLRKLQN